MDLDRLADGEPPLRVSQLARMIGYSHTTVRKLVREQAIEHVILPSQRERRIPVAEARRLLRELRLMPAEKAQQTQHFTRP